MTDADVHRSTPGYVYGVASHCTSEREEVEPPCSCPCHVADAPYPTGWYCDRCYVGLTRWTTEDKPRVPYTHEQAIADGTTNPQPYLANVVDYYFITKGNTLADELGEHFATMEEADERAAELNRADVLTSLNLSEAAIVRRERLKRLGETFWVRYGDGPKEARWPKEPGRYAVKSYSDRYSESFWDTVDSLDDIERDADRVYDLDEDKEVPFLVRIDFS